VQPLVSPIPTTVENRTPAAILSIVYLQAQLSKARASGVQWAKDFAVFRLPNERRALFREPNGLGRVFLCSMAWRLALALWLVLGGCSDHDPSPTDMEDGAAGAGGEEVSCTDDERVEVFARGLSKSGETGFKVTIDAGDPAPPARGDNTWTVTVLDAAGEPLAGARLAVSALMPDHGHMSPSTPEATVTDAEGRSTISGLNLFMAGVWVVQLQVTEADAEEQADSVSFAFCVEG
jgi:hypothetical protein